ncbi:MAG TPA: Ig-like domain-containing protein [Candidatus Polarisedimenticolaceae bacterium]|nr:Ig-like domain-containing protein [Candidatus Polarisedimenticolaceae bacterium]
MKLLATFFKKYKMAANGLACLLLFVAFGWTFSYFSQPIKVTHSLTNLKVDSRIAVSFSHPVRDQINYNISPSLEGEWRVKRNLFGITSLKFDPSEPLVPGSNYRLILGHVTPLLAPQPTIPVQTLKVTVEKPAAIVSISPAGNSTNVPIDTSITVKLASPNHGLRKLALTGDAPLLSPNPTTSDDKVFVWRLAKPLSQTTTYHLTLADLKQKDVSKSVLATAAFSTVAEPHVVSATSRDHFYPGDVISVVFDQDMKPAEGGFKFGFGGSGRWQDARTYLFTPAGLKPGSAYSYIAQKGLQSKLGGVVEADRTYSIIPPGAVVVTSMGPSGTNASVKPSITFTFDQPVDHASAQAAFSISPATAGSFNWSGNTMVFQSAGLGYQTGYTVAVAPGVKGIHGLPSARAFSNSFSTTYPTLKLAVPGYHQAYPLSCESSALRMALAYRGIAVSDFEILVRLNYNPRPRDQANNSWDNPYQMFVGDVNGQMGVTGWGVYGPPIAAAAQSFGRSASYVSGISVNQIAQAIHSNNPVVLWGYSGASVRPDGWNTSSGVVQAPRNEHVRTVYGVAGTPANPIGFYIHDPIYGDLYWTTSQLQWNMGYGGSMASQGVIVY